MQALSSLGWNISILRIRGAEKLVFGGSPFSGFWVLPIMFRPVYWFRGLIWAFRKRGSEFQEIRNDLFSVKADMRIKLKLFFLLFTVLGMAEYMDANRIPVTHIRAHFLHNETLGAYWLARILHLPYSITIHTRMMYYPYSLLQKAVQNASFCVGISDETVELAGSLRGSLDGVFLIRKQLKPTILT
jgi:hypothetical protein